MRSKREKSLERAAGSRRPSPVGGKSLQRLLEFLGTRNPALNDEVIATVPLPKAARPRFLLTPAALRGPVRKTAKRPGRAKSGDRPAAKLANRLIEAAAALEEPAPGAPPGPAAAAMSPWRFLGPKVIPNGQTYGSNRIAVTGRVACLAIDPGNRRHLLCGAAGGGIWESTDDGATWLPRTDRMPSLAIGAIAFDPSHPQTVYAGSGEGNFYFSLGAGVYRSTDGGTTWDVIAKAPFVGVGFFALIVDPANRNALYAATTNGFYRSANGGTTWTQKRPGKCWNISLHPAGGAAAEILATFIDGLFVSTNGGGSFAPVALPGNTTSFWRRLAVDRVASAPDVAYVFGAGTQSAHLWRRMGATWTKITSLPIIKITQAGYDWFVATPPDTANEVFVGAIDAFRGRLTGTTWRWKNITTQGSHSIHPDQHSLTFSPGYPRTIYAGNDGGLYRSTDDGDSWASLNDGLAITEVEYMASDPATSNWLMAGTQDNGTIRFSSTGWQNIANGDGGDCGVNPLNAMEVYHSFYNVSLERSNNKGNSWTGLRPPSMSSLFYPPVSVFGRTVAIGGVALVVTRTGGPPWQTVTLGLTPGDVVTTSCMRDADTIYVGTRFGKVIQLAWSGTSWIRTPLAAPFAAYMSCIATDPGNPQRLWATSSQASVGNGMVSRSDNNGGQWTNCTAGLPRIPKNSVTVDPANGNRIWVAADVGVYESADLGATWHPFSDGLPNAMAVDLLFHKQDRKLFCATRNRGVWIASVT